MPELRDPGPVLDLRLQQGADRFGARGREVGVVDEHDQDHALVEDVHDPLLRGVVAEGGQRAVEMIPAVLADRWMAPSRSWFCETIHPLARSAFQIASPFSRPKASRSLGFSTSEARGPSRLPVARSRKLPSRLKALSRGSRWSSRRLWTRRVRFARACSRERYGVSARPAATFANSSMHWPIAVNCVNERRKSPRAGSWFQPSNG